MKPEKPENPAKNRGISTKTNSYQKSMKKYLTIPYRSGRVLLSKRDGQKNPAGKQQRDRRKSRKAIAQQKGGRK